MGIPVTTLCSDPCGDLASHQAIASKLGFFNTLCLLMGVINKADWLDNAGCCKFKHMCMQWVSDKGSHGMCGGDHPKVRFTYDASKKLSSPLP